MSKPSACRAYPCRRQARRRRSRRRRFFRRAAGCNAAAAHPAGASAPLAAQAPPCSAWLPPHLRPGVLRLRRRHLSLRRLRIHFRLRRLLLRPRLRLRLRARAGLQWLPTHIAILPAPPAGPASTPILVPDGKQLLRQHNRAPSHQRRASRQLQVLWRNPRRQLRQPSLPMGAALGRMGAKYRRRGELRKLQLGTRPENGPLQELPGRTLQLAS